jgi:molybdopterin-guanine dinucleotide biosynthesis protein A
LPDYTQKRLDEILNHYFHVESVRVKSRRYDLPLSFFLEFTPHVFLTCLQFMRGEVCCLDRSAIILADASQGKFDEDIGLLKVANKPLLNHVVDAVKGVVGEVLVVTASKEQSDFYAKVVSSSNVKFIINSDEPQGSLAAALTGFEAAQGDYSLVLPYNAPFISKEVVSLLFELSAGKSAVVPRWTSSEIEPLHAVYHTGLALEAAKKALEAGEVDVSGIVGCLRGVRYVSTLVIEQLDPDFRTFFRVFTPIELKKAAAMTKLRKHA